MSDKKYYWIRLKTNFFSQEIIDFLLSQKNGCQYVVLYQMLCLNTANSDGALVTNINEMLVPYDINKIVRDTKYFDFDTVSVALELFKKLGLIYEEQDGILKITNYSEMVGSESGNANAQRQKRFRERKKQELLSVTENNVTSVTDGVMENNEEYRDKSIEYRDIDIKETTTNVVVKKNKNSEEWFNTFWTAYPNKANKKKSKERFLKICTSEEMFNIIMEGMKKTVIAKANAEGTQYIPMASTWLNGERWNDEPYREPTKSKSIVRDSTLDDIF